MTGTMKAVFNDTLGGKLTVSGPVTLYSNGGLYADLTGTGIAYISSTKQKIKITSGTLYQIPVTGDITGQTVPAAGSVARTLTKHRAAK